MRIKCYDVCQCLGECLVHGKHSVDEAATVSIITRFPHFTELREEDGQVGGHRLEAKVGLRSWTSSSQSGALASPLLVSISDPKSFICIQLTQSICNKHTSLSCQRPPQKTRNRHQASRMEIPQDNLWPSAQVQAKKCLCPDIFTDQQQGCDLRALSIGVIRHED